jgi:hypothetical protein
MKKHNIQNASAFATKQLGDKLNKVIEEKELTFEEQQEKRAKEFNKEMYVQGIFLGFILGAIYLAVFSSILEKL